MKWSLGRRRILRHFWILLKKHYMIVHKSMRLKCQIIRKQRAVGNLLPLLSADVGLVPEKSKLTRECLEEAVLASQRTLSHHPVSQKIPFCCFNGGSDVWIDVGDKSLGVSVLQRYFHNSTISKR